MLKNLPKEKKNLVIVWLQMDWFQKVVQEGNLRGACFVPFLLLDVVLICVTNLDI